LPARITSPNERNLKMKTTAQNPSAKLKIAIASC